MGRGPATFKQTDLTRALRAAQRAGIEVESFEIDRAGKIVVIAAQAATVSGGKGESEWANIP
jgi:hypothetical protein